MSPLYTFSNASEALPKLLNRALFNGAVVPSRNGETKELLMEQFTLSRPWQRYIVTPGRRVSLPAQIAETMWLLAGRDDIGWLENYLPRAKDFSDDGEIWRGAYGPRIRRWQYGTGTLNTNTDEIEYLEDPVDQLAHVAKLLAEDPGTRRAVITIYDPSIDTQPGKDIPCNNWVHFVQRDGKLHGHVCIRSNDIFWGWSGINQFEWSALLEIVAGLVGMKVGTLTFSVSSLHLYERHYERAAGIVKESGTRVHTEAFDAAPRFAGGKVSYDLGTFDDLVAKWFRLEQMIREEPRGSAWMYLQNFPEPMLRSWLIALYAWWHGDIDTVFQENSAATHLVGTDLEACLKASPERKKPESTITVASEGTTIGESQFVEFVAQLHREKHEAYGDSWKKRGEMLGIMANIARKMDRLGVAGGGDTAADTAIDLLVYLIKYRLWLEEQADGKDRTSNADFVTGKLKAIKESGKTEQFKGSDTALESYLEALFEHLEGEVTGEKPGEWNREVIVDFMIPAAYALAYRLWTKEQKEAWKAGNATRTWKGYGA